MYLFNPTEGFLEQPESASFITHSNLPCVRSDFLVFFLGIKCFAWILQGDKRRAPASGEDSSEAVSNDGISSKASPMPFAAWYQWRRTYVSVAAQQDRTALQAQPAKQYSARIQER